MSDVVGTAFVRIKALTNKLSKDIEASVKKGMKDAKIDKIAGEEGDKAGAAFGDKFADASGKTLKRRSKDVIPGDDLVKDFSKGFEKAFNKVDLPNFDQLELFDGSDFDINVNFDVDSDDLDDATDSLDDITDRIRENGSLDRSLKNLASRFKSLGSSGGLNVGILKSKLALLGGVIAAALPYIQDIGSAILAYGTGLVAQVGALTTAVAGLSTAAVAALGSVALSIIPIALAFKSQTTFLTDFKDSAKAAGEEFLRIGTATQQTLLPLLDEALFIIGRLVPMFSEYGLIVGNTVGQFARLAAETLTGTEAQDRFSKILQSSLRIIEKLNPVLLNIGDILSGIWVAAIPASERFVDSLGGMVERWSDLINVGLETGTLTKTLDEWYNRAELIFGALGNLTGALFDILQVGANSSDNLFVRFDEWAQRFRDFTESEAGQNRLALIFENSLAVMREINGVVADLFDGIFGRLGEVGGVDSMVAALQRFREILPGIQEQFQEMLDTIERVTDVIASSVWEKFQLAIEELSEPLGRLIVQFLEFLAVMNDSGAFEVFLDLMRILADVLSTLLAIPGFGQFVGYMLAFGAAAKVASFALGPFLKIFGGFASLLIKGGLGVRMAGLAGSLQGLARGFKAVSASQGVLTLSQAMTAGAGRAGSLSGAIGGLAAKLPLLGPLGIAAGAGIGVAGVAFFKAQQQAQRWEQEIRQVTDSLGLLNEGLYITAAGVSKYVDENSRFDSRNQEDDLRALGITVEKLGAQYVAGELNQRKFADSALADGQTWIQLNGVRKDEITSLQQLQEEYGLTSRQIDELAKGNGTYARGIEFVVGGNKDLLRSYEELPAAIGAAAKKSIDAFVSNSQNIRLLGTSALAQIKEDIESKSDEDAGQVMITAQRRLAAEARRSTREIKGLSDATIQQAKAQLQGNTADERAIELNRILTNESRKLSRQIREDLDLFRSDSFAAEYGEAKDAVLDFSKTMQAVQDFGLELNVDEGLDAMLTSMGPVKDATFELFEQLKGLPEAEFNAAARALGQDAESLRGAMEGAYRAIEDLQEKALATLPSIGEALDKATTTNEDGTQAFDREGFTKAINDRVKQTEEFAYHIAYIKRKSGDEAARLAAQEGPEAAKNLAEMVAADPNTLTEILGKMESAEEALRTQIKDTLGPGIAAEYGVAAGLIGEGFGSSLAGALNSDATLAALNRSSLDALNEMEKTFQGHFEFDSSGTVLRFVPTGRKRSAPRTFSVARQGGGAFFSAGGFVDGAVFGSGPRGTDTVPAWLTPGEFVLRRAVAQAIPASVLQSLNAGDPRMIGLLTSLAQSRPGSPTSVTASAGASTGGASSGGSLVIQQMNIEAPTPLEAARQTAARLKIVQSQLVSR